jgi:hypothetical protein
MKLPAESLELVGIDMKRVVKPGVFDVMVGPSSAETTTVALHVVGSESPKP